MKTKINKLDFFFLLGLSILFIGIIVSSADFCFFWDTVSIVSKQTHYLYENRFSDFLFPVSFDNADPQLLQSYLALCWLIFGKSIEVAHLAIIPLTIGIVVFIFLISKYLFGDKTAYFSSILLLADPSLITQCIIMSPDVLLILFSLSTLSGILKRKNLLIAISLLLLTLVNRRAMMISAGLMLSIFYLEIFVRKNPFNKTTLKKLILIFAPACISVLGYLWFRYQYFGWVLTHPDSPWYSTSQTVDATMFIKNILKIGRAFLDNGKFIWWILLLIAFFKLGYKKIFSPETKELWIILFSILIALLPATLLLENPFGGRYFIVHSLLLAFITIQIITYAFTRKQVYVILSITFLTVFTGNLWVMPEKISQSWDCSLAHLPYYELREEVKTYFDKHQIDYGVVGFGFPNTAEIKYIETNNNTRKFSNIDPNKNTYIVYSNIQNLDDETISQIKENYVLTKSFKKGGIFMDIYKKKK